MRKFYLTPPTYFDIEYIINEWMDPKIKVDKPLAQAQWETLFDTYQSFEVDVEILEPIEGLPDLVFPGDAIFLFNNNVVAGNMRFAERAPEVAPRVKIFKDKGYKVHHLPNHIKFEGNAETIHWNNILFGGYGLRSDPEVYPILSDILDIEIIPLKINPPYFHLDVALCPLNENTLAYVPDAFNQTDRDTIESLAKNTIKVSKKEAHFLAINSIVIDNTVILSTHQAPDYSKKLEENGFDLKALDLSEFHKSGGGAKCLTLEEYMVA